MVDVSFLKCVKVPPTVLPVHVVYQMTERIQLLS